MRCPRCHTRNDGASWYCRSCGEPLADLNVADSVGPRSLPALVRASLWLSGGLLVLVSGAILLAAKLIPGWTRSTSTSLSPFARFGSS